MDFKLTRNLDFNSCAMAAKITQLKSAPERRHCSLFGRKSGSVKA